MPLGGLLAAEYMLFSEPFTEFEPDSTAGEKAESPSETFQRAKSFDDWEAWLRDARHVTRAFFDRVKDIG